MKTNKTSHNARHGARHDARQDQSDRDLSLQDAEAGLEPLLSNFRSSVHAWSEAELSRPRMVPAAHRHSWRFAAAWALGCLVAAGSLSAGLYEHYRGQLLAAANAHQSHILQVQQEQQEQIQTAQAAITQPAAGQRDEGLLASVDNDVSQPVPSAMEPLAQLMDDNGDQ